MYMVWSIIVLLYLQSFHGVFFLFWLFIIALIVCPRGNYLIPVDTRNIYAMLCIQRRKIKSKLAANVELQLVSENDHSFIHMYRCSVKEIEIKVRNMKCTIGNSSNGPRSIVLN